MSDMGKWIPGGKIKWKETIVEENEVTPTQEIAPEPQPEATKVDDNTKFKADTFYLYDNATYKQLLLKIDTSNRFKAVYDHYNGVMTGEYHPETGLLKGTWCEEEAGGDDDDGEVNIVSGLVAFSMKSIESGISSFDGRWTDEDPNVWTDDWDLTRIVNDPIPDALVNRFNGNSSCDSLLNIN